MIEITNGICGYEAHREDGKAKRVIVQGIFHVGGTDKHPCTDKLIRFKSIASAERHIRNMKLVK